MIEDVKAIVSHLKRRRRPVVCLLQPGLSAEEIAKHEAKLPFNFTPEIVELYQFRNGTQANEGDALTHLDFFPGYHWLSLQHAVCDYRSRRRSRQWRTGWFPVFGDEGGSYYAVSCDPVDPPGVIGFLRGEPEQEVEYLTLTSMFKTIAECFDNGAFFVKQGVLDSDDAKHAEIAAKHNPGLTVWTRADEEEKESQRNVEALKLATQASRWVKKKTKVLEALAMLEEALASRSLPNWAYVNGLWAVMSENNNHPKDPSRIRRMLEICLPRGESEPDIYVNAAFCYMELGEVDQVIECFRKAKRCGVDLQRHLSDKALASIANDKRFTALKSNRSRKSGSKKSGRG